MREELLIAGGTYGPETCNVLISRDASFPEDSGAR